MPCTKKIERQDLAKGGGGLNAAGVAVILIKIPSVINLKEQRDCAAPLKLKIS